ncbi:peptidoglycan-binding protein [Kitasatospora sp. NPDC004615]|uniref:peptidoglycan-binding domain-containing protein n=1 Tax=Kitasatospora sp. NPDC004615 TaxID=3364017 RepID=UPI0036C86879
MRRIVPASLATAALAVGLLGIGTGTAQAATASCTTSMLDMGVIVPATSSYSTDCLLGQGNQSEAVQVLQGALNVCYGQNISSDGVFGPATKSALIAVQRQIGVSADGTYGPNTRDHMKFIKGSINTGDSVCRVY